MWPKMQPTVTRLQRNILLVEDDSELSTLISDYLGENGLTVDVVDHGDEAEEAVRRLAPDLVILDLMLPGKDGLELCKDLRAWYRGPLLLLTARSGWVDEIVGLELGADDYLGKPVEPRLLLARVRTLLRRTEAFSAEETQRKHPTGLELDSGRRTARLGGQHLELTDAEFDLLVYLKSHEGQTLTRDQLSRDVWESAYDGLGRSIDVRIGRLSSKLGDDAKRSRWIKSVRGVGYLFLEPKD